MCIVLLTTAHPDYALIVIDNRDEFILRPTSRPHWWSPTSSTSDSAQSSKAQVLSSRDLQRSERGTWLGITKEGNFAVLTNYRETNSHDQVHPVHGQRSRGAMVTAWLGANPDETVQDFVKRLMEGEGVRGVGGFSLICGRLRKRPGEKQLEPLGILSNRYEHFDEVPWICGERGVTYGLSNAVYADPSSNLPLWPKVEEGIGSLKSTMRHAAEKGLQEEELIQELFNILDSDKFPRHPDLTFANCITELKQSVFIPAMGDEQQQKDMEEARSGKAAEAAAELRGEERPDEQALGFMKGLYGTQRQTIILVDWDGNATYKERALWDTTGKPIPKGEGDVSFKFKIDGWE